jgi:hypothetical protein
MSEQPPLSSSRTRLAPLVAVLLAIAAQLSMSDPIVLLQRWVAPGIELVLVGILLVWHPIDRARADRLRGVRFLLGGTLVVSASASTVLLMRELFHNNPKLTLSELLAEGGEILFLSVIGFAVLYWQLDRGGPDGRQRYRPDRVAFWFPQDGIREYSDEYDLWQPRYIDYLYVSSTNLVAFSPTDTMPLTRTAKMLMLWQSIIAILTIGLVLARAINIIPSP